MAEVAAASEGELWVVINFAVSRHDIGST